MLCGWLITRMTNSSANDSVKQDPVYTQANILHGRVKLVVWEVLVKRSELLLWQQWHDPSSWIVLWRPVHRSHCQSPPHWTGLPPLLDTAIDRQHKNTWFKTCFFFIKRKMQILQKWNCKCQDEPKNQHNGLADVQLNYQFLPMIIYQMAEEIATGLSTWGTHLTINLQISCLFHDLLKLLVNLCTVITQNHTMSRDAGVHKPICTETHHLINDVKSTTSGKCWHTSLNSSEGHMEVWAGLACVVGGWDWCGAGANSQRMTNDYLRRWRVAAGALEGKVGQDETL